MFHIPDHIRLQRLADQAAADVARAADHGNRAAVRLWASLADHYATLASAARLAAGEGI